MIKAVYDLSGLPFDDGFQYSAKGISLGGLLDDHQIKSPYAALSRAIMQALTLTEAGEEGSMGTDVRKRQETAIDKSETWIVVQ